MSELNLLPYEMRHKSQGPVKTKYIVSAGIAAVIVIGIAIAIPMVITSSLKHEKSSLQNYISSNSSILSENEKLRNSIKDYNDYVAIASNVKDSRTLSAAIIRNIEKYIPSPVTLTSLNYSNGVIQINAASSDYNALCIFSANLQTSKEFAGSAINIITNNAASSGGSSGYISSITINLTGGEAVEGTQH